MATIGADPELAVGNLEDIVRAETVFSHMVASDFPYGNFGRDGSGGPMELRPRPSFQPGAVVRNIGRLLSSARSQMPSGLSFFCGGWAEEAGPIGGHLHAWGRESTRTRLGAPHNRARVCVGLTLLWWLEDYPLGMKRRTGGYGGFNDVRRGNPTYEFRSPSGDWVATPTIAYHCLSYFQQLVDNVDKFGQDLDQLESIMTSTIEYWKNQPNSSRDKYHQSVVDFVKSGVRGVDLTRIEFFANKISRLREDTGSLKGLIRIDAPKWEEKARCVD